MNDKSYSAGCWPWVVLTLGVTLFSYCSRAEIKKPQENPTRTCFVGVDQLTPFYRIGGPIVIETDAAMRKMTLRNGFYRSSEPLNPEQIREHIEVVDCEISN